MPILTSAAAALVVAVVYCAYCALERVRLDRERRLRGRVAFMLWTMAEQDEDGEPLYAPTSGTLWDMSTKDII